MPAVGHTCVCPLLFDHCCILLPGWRPWLRSIRSCWYKACYQRIWRRQAHGSGSFCPTRNTRVLRQMGLQPRRFDPHNIFLLDKTNTALPSKHAAGQSCSIVFNIYSTVWAVWQKKIYLVLLQHLCSNLETGWKFKVTLLQTLVMVCHVVNNELIMHK